MTGVVLAPGATIGIVGGGQLGRMLGIAAAQLGYITHIFAPEEGAVAAATAQHITHAAYDDRRALGGFAGQVDVISFEFENVPVDTMRFLAEHRPLFPPVDALAVAQDRVTEKKFAASCGVPLAPWAEIRSAAALAAAVADIGTPAILKTARDGYDGKGQARINAGDAPDAAWAAIGNGRAVLERQIDFTGEFSILLVRGQDGEVCFWDAPENRHVDGILRQSNVPAPPEMADQIATAQQHAQALAAALDYVGVMACEFFATDDGPLFNELAPRVHNSGHWTIEGSVTSQFENHIRAICGLPLGATGLTGAAVTMDNLIGTDADDWASWLGQGGAHLHLYGKGAPRAGRKMGHVTRVEVA